MSDRSPQPALMPAEAPMVELRDLHKSFATVKALDGVSVRFPPGRVTVVLGPSGSGKSVMLKHIIGLLRPTRGEVWFDGNRIDQLSEKALSRIRTRFGYLFQQGALFDSMTVGENLEFPLREHGRKARDARQERIDRVLRMVGLPEKIDSLPEDLSGGQRKRIALARAIVLEPEVILYDEPTTGLDPINSDVINELILKLQHDLNVTSIVVTHDLALAFKVADRIVIMREGRIVTEGEPKEVRESRDEFVQQFLEGRASEEDLIAFGASHTAADDDKREEMRAAV